MDQSVQLHPNWMIQCGNLSFYLLKNQLIDDFVSAGVHKRPGDCCGRAASEKKIDLERRSSVAFLSVTKRPQGFSTASSKKLHFTGVSAR